MKKIELRSIKELESFFTYTLETYLPIWALPDGSLLYKNYRIKQLSNQNWGVFNFQNKDFVDQFFTKSCALIAADSHLNVNVNIYNQVKQLDTRYWAHCFDATLYRNSINNSRSYEDYLTFVNKLEYTKLKETYYKNKIAEIFVQTLVSPHRLRFSRTA